ncbi:hypothetical protein RN001_002932 [Aquatica leii]|uniref:Uncharacterized protein n=1 Tax=Aquatica leii TaxID=1421715 RepID=A0AAN7PN06_9COLE|nr:hypothetical protein RN001_002932 [Aquatica leii]
MDILLASIYIDTWTNAEVNNDGLDFKMPALRQSRRCQVSLMFVILNAFSFFLAKKVSFKDVTTYYFKKMISNLPRKKQKKATETSELESLVESQSELTDNQSHRKKRKTMKTTFTRFASFEVSDDDTSCETYAMLPEPPKCKSVNGKKKATVNAVIRKNDALIRENDALIRENDDALIRKNDDALIRQNDTNYYYDDGHAPIVNPAITQATICDPSGQYVSELRQIHEYFKKILLKMANPFSVL